MSWNGSIHFSSAGKCLPLSRMQTILQAGLLAPGSSYSPAFPNQGSVALSAFVPVTAAGPLPARIDSTLTGFPITPFRHPEVRYFYITLAVLCQLLRASINGASVAPSTGISQRSLPLNLASLGFALELWHKPAEPPPQSRFARFCPGHLSLIMKAGVGSHDLIHGSYCFSYDGSSVLLR